MAQPKHVTVSQVETQVLKSQIDNGRWSVMARAQELARRQLGCERAVLASMTIQTRRGTDRYNYEFAVFTWTAG